ncbi:hypothetical protein [Amycolatopsis solani]|uniref:hypothetical protein n=1 Tax=Amycolatopsis solani TaxID=3028615 RepID=UPI0025B26B99|nr:hypothetical protein [Amycolatopsis sp. MEP2-6]
MKKLFWAAQHWWPAWTGFDAAEACGLLATAWLLGRGDPRTPFAAIGTATLRPSVPAHV